MACYNYNRFLVPRCSALKQLVNPRLIPSPSNIVGSPPWIDVANWIMDAHPVKANGMGARQIRVGPGTGDIYEWHDWPPAVD